MQPPTMYAAYNTSSKNVISQMVENNGVKNIMTAADTAEIFLKARIHKRYENPLMKIPLKKTGSNSFLLGN